MEIAPLSLIQRDASSPHRGVNHLDSLVFSISSQKMNSQKETILLDDSKQIKNSASGAILKDYFSIQDKIKLLEEKVENIRTNYCEPNVKQQCTWGKQNQPGLINLEFPEEIYEKKATLMKQQQQIGKIKRKKSKYYTGTQLKNRSRSKSITRNQQSLLSTKRNNNTTANMNDFSMYKPKNSFQKQNETIRNVNSNQRERSQSCSIKNQSHSFSNNQVSEIHPFKKGHNRNKLSNDKLSRKSNDSQKKKNMSKDQKNRLKNQNTRLQKENTLLRQKLKRNETIKQKQKETIQKQKDEIDELKKFLEEVMKRSKGNTLRQSLIVYQNEPKVKYLKKHDATVIQISPKTQKYFCILYKFSKQRVCKSFILGRQCHLNFRYLASCFLASITSWLLLRQK